MNCACPPSRCGGHDHATRDPVRHLGAELLAQQVQARVEARGGAGARDDAAVLHVEHVGIDVDLRVHLRHRVGVHPVRRRLATVEHARRREDERPAADAQHPRVAGDGVADDVEHALVGVRPVLAGRRRDDHEIGLVGERQIVLDVDREAELGLHDAGSRSDDAEVEIRDAVIRPVESEGLARDAELEGCEAVLDDHGDCLHGSSDGGSFHAISGHSATSGSPSRKRSVSAMFMVILLAVLSTVAIASTIATVRNDGYRRTPTDWSRLS